MLHRKSKLDRIDSFVCFNCNNAKSFLKGIGKNQRPQGPLDF